MPRQSSDQVITQKHHRTFIQQGGAGPENSLQYAGQTGTYFVVGDIDNPVSGGVSKINFYNESQYGGGYKTIGITEEAADFPSVSLTLMDPHGRIPWFHQDNLCPFTVYDLSGTCKDPSNFLRGWSNYMRVLSGLKPTDRSTTAPTSQDSDEVVTTELSCTITGGVYTLGSISFGEQAGTEVGSTVVGAVYGTQIQCAGCGKANDGTKWIYTVAKYETPSATTPTEVIYTTDGGATWSQVTVGTGAETPVAITIVGTYLVVVCTTSFFYSDINTLTGVPGTFTEVVQSAWSTHNAKGITVLSQREVFVCGEDGYIYKSSNIPSGFVTHNAGAATTADLHSISNDGGDVLVAVGVTGTVIRSSNRGETFSSTTTEPDGAVTNLSVGVKDKYQYWVGTNDGKLWYTLDGGETWTESAFSGEKGSGTIDSIVWVTDEVMHFAHANGSSVARIYTTSNGGVSFDNNVGASPRLVGFPVCDKILQIAVPYTNDRTIAANNICAVGIAADGTDGIIVLGKPNIS